MSSRNHEILENGMDISCVGLGHAQLHSDILPRGLLAHDVSFRKFGAAQRGFVGT